MRSRAAFTVKILLCCSAFLLGSTLTLLAHAEEDATRVAARALGTEGVNAYLEEDYPLALSRLESAYAVLRVPSLALWSARALEKNGQLVEASERYLEATKLELGSEGNRDIQKQAQEDAATDREALLLRMPRVTIKLQGREPHAVELSIAGQAVSSGFVGRPRPTNPGQTEIIAKSGDLVRHKIINLSEGQTEEATFHFPPIKNEPEGEASLSGSANLGGSANSSGDSAMGDSRAWQRPMGWAGIGVGGAGIVFGAVTGAMALSAFKKFNCQDKYCPNATDKELSNYNTERTLSSIAFIAGGVIAGAGLTLLLTAPKRDAAPPKDGASASVFFAPSKVGVQGSF